MKTLISVSFYDLSTTAEGLPEQIESTDGLHHFIPQTDWEFTLEKYFVSITCRNYDDSMENDSLYRDLMAELIWRLSGNLICHVFSFHKSIIKSPK